MTFMLTVTSPQTPDATMSTASLAVADDMFACASDNRPEAVTVMSPIVPSVMIFATATSWPVCAETASDQMLPAPLDMFNSASAEAPPPQNPLLLARTSITAVVQGDRATGGHQVRLGMCRIRRRTSTASVHVDSADRAIDVDIRVRGSVVTCIRVDSQRTNAARRVRQVQFGIRGMPLAITVSELMLPVASNRFSSASDEPPFAMTSTQPPVMVTDPPALAEETVASASDERPRPAH